MKQVRKYTGEPYINHPANVVATLRLVTANPAELAAGWLHDVVEDTGTTLDEVYAEFGFAVTTIVDGVTNKALPNDGNRRKRFEKNMMAIAAADAGAHTVRLADILDNTRNIVALAPAFAPLYLAEKVELLQVLTKGNSLLHHWATTQINEQLALLEKVA